MKDLQYLQRLWQDHANLAEVSMATDLEVSSAPIAGEMAEGGNFVLMLSHILLILQTSTNCQWMPW
jgi:hypothetical protein